MASPPAPRRAEWCGDAHGPVRRRKADAGAPRKIGRGPSSGSGSPDHDLADLDYGSLVGVVGNVGHDFLGVRTEARLEGLDRIAENMAHADVSRRGSRG